ncbi:uncharacterized protein LOC123526692 [Mercenaria mercenaria]|uniref:uncharacterized protein LOC123526692 n=1 Tax=Mercenaria mercenaria TaxID=6596 RepID=UPI00234EF777|nr:uncharacterized protein LOC123526692 [Mercenaria mercenaria]
MSTSFNQWQTTRFSVFTRPSRVEVNTQKDLEDMLSKLDDTTANADVNEHVQRKLFTSRRKFLELALPCGILALLSLLYSLIYLVDAGERIVSSVKTDFKNLVKKKHKRYFCTGKERPGSKNKQSHITAALPDDTILISRLHGLYILTIYLQTRDFLTQVETLDCCLATILHEHSDRITSVKGNSELLSKDYHLTDEALQDVLNTKTLAEWKLLSQITDWRNKRSRDIIEESEFYLQFAADLKAVIFERGFRLKEIRKWKALYEYLTSMRNAFQVDVILNILRLLETNAPRLKIETNAEKTISFVAKFKSVLCEADKGYDNVKIACSFELLCSLHASSMNFSINEPCWNNTTKFDSNKVKNLRTKIQEKLINLLREIESSNTKTLTVSAILFCMLFVFIGTTAACISLFVYIFREQTQVAVVVSDMLKGVTSRVDKQRESTDQVVNRLIPRNLVRKVNVDHHSNMIPYEAPDTTIFMVSIAGYEKFFNMFTAAQTIHILTLVMELLDERMEQYNVLPVARMGQYVLVLSESEVKKQVRNACEIANLAIDIMTCCSDLEIGRHSTSKLQMKLAIHTGPCYGRLVVHNGTVQLKIVGNTLTVLRQIHKAAIPNMIQVSETTQKLLAACECYSLHYRGNIKIPDMSKYYKVYWLNGRRVSSALSVEDCCSRMGSWIELERKPLYRLDENDGTYEPLNKSACRRYSQMSAGSYNPTAYPNTGTHLGDSETSL